MSVVEFIADFVGVITKAKLNPDPILVWAESGQLNGVLEGSVMEIRKAINYLASDTGMQTLN